MTMHLAPEEFTALLDGSLAANRAAHLDECASCRATVADAVSALEAARDVRVPEPSPLFWDHLSARVKDATRASAAPRAGWWQPIWRPLAALGAAAALVAIVTFDQLEAPPGTATSAGSSSAAPREDDTSWGSVAAMTSNLSSDEIQRVMAPMPTSMVLLDELSPKERQAFVQLLKAEMGEIQ